MSEQTIKSLTLLQKSLVSFFDELIEMFPQEGDFVAFRIMIKDRIPITNFVGYFKKSLLPVKDKIKTKTSGGVADISLVQVMNSLFADVGISTASFANILVNLDPETEEAFWKWLDVFCTLTEKC